MAKVLKNQGAKAKKKEAKFTVGKVTLKWGDTVIGEMESEMETVKEIHVEKITKEYMRDLLKQMQTVDIMAVERSL